MGSSFLPTREEADLEVAAPSLSVPPPSLGGSAGLIGAVNRAALGAIWGIPIRCDVRRTPASSGSRHPEIAERDYCRWRA